MLNRHIKVISYFSAVVFFVVGLSTCLTSCILETGFVAPTGSPCEYRDDCEGGVCLHRDYVDSRHWVPFPDGYCSQECNRQYDCDGYSICVRINDYQNRCLMACDSSAECRDGYYCHVANWSPWIAFCFPHS